MVKGVLFSPPSLIPAHTLSKLILGVDFFKKKIYMKAVLKNILIHFKFLVDTLINHVLMSYPFLVLEWKKFEHPGSNVEYSQFRFNHCINYLTDAIFTFLTTSMGSNAGLP